MNNHFTESNQLVSYSQGEDGFIVDYTNKTDSLRGVELLKSPPNDINYFQLINRGAIEFWGVNFEKCSSLFKKGSENCECMFVAKQAKNLKWACLVELKYCLDKEPNLTENINYAKSQLINTLQILFDNAVLNNKDYKIYLNISIPDSAQIPFTSFLTTPDIIAQSKEEGFILYGFNKLKILNASFLVPNKEKI